MINGKSNPVEWALMSYDIEEVIEHLQTLYDRLTPDSEIDEIDFAISVGHVYAHLNRIWNSRNHVGEMSHEQFVEFTKFPTDLNTSG
jgi:hypothetical protein